MTYNGAAGTTQQGMAQAMQLQSLTAQTVDTDNAALQASLISPDPQVQLTIANSLWMHLATNPVLPAFIQANQTYYGAEVGDLSGAPANVNAWVSAKTNGLITQILPQADYSKVVAVIANALYFKGAWTVKFDPTQTAATPFTLADGTQTTCQMMNQTGTYGYYQGSNFQMLNLPYGQGRMSMVIILPATGTSLNAFLPTLTPATLNAWFAQLQNEGVYIGLPRFTATYTSSMKDALTSLGMGTAFDPNQANFSGLAPNTMISDVAHATQVQVDETGTVAAAATTVTITPTDVTAPLFTMTMNHPFLYLIRDNKTGMLLFVGALVNPS
jgi:serpin B